MSGEHHNKDGPLTVSNLRCVNPLSHAFIKAATQCSYALPKIKANYLSHPDDIKTILAGLKPRAAS